MSSPPQTATNFQLQMSPNESMMTTSIDAVNILSPRQPIRSPPVGVQGLTSPTRGPTNYCQSRPRSYALQQCPQTHCSQESVLRSTQTATESYGGLEYTFLEEVPNEFLCSVCTKVFCKPHLTDCCGQHYCHSCLQHWIASGVSDTCPSCRSHDFSHMHDKKLERRINELKIECTNADQGCDWEGTISELARHLNVGSSSVKGCQFVMCECELQCGEVMLRKNIKVHLQATCPLREVTCEHCNQIFTYQDIVRFHFMTCGEKMVLCDKNCGQMVKRRDMQTHQEELCPNTITQCPFADMGCQQLVLRKDHDQHIAVCKETYLSSTVIKMKEQLSAQRKELLVAREEYQSLRKEIIHLKRGILVSHHNLEILRHNTNTMCEVISSELPFLHTSRNCPSEQLALDCIKTQISCSPVHLESGRGSATFRMTNYASHKETGRVWYTSPFLVTNGYTMCFGVHPNGVGAGKGTHVSIYLYQLTGMYDSELKWPYLLEEDFQVCLMSQVDQASGCGRMRSRSREKSQRGLPGLSPKQKQKTLEHQMDTLTLPREYGEREVELVKSKSLPASPTLAQRQPSNEATSSSNEQECPPSQFVVENQVLRVSQYISQPIQSSCNTPIHKLELFCLRKTVENAIYRDSIVLWCSLRVKQDTEEFPPPVTGGEGTSGWKTWQHDSV